jgi:hypothetical protein
MCSTQVSATRPVSSAGQPSLRSRVPFVRLAGTPVRVLSGGIRNGVSARAIQKLIDVRMYHGE